MIEDKSIKSIRAKAFRDAANYFRKARLFKALDREGVAHRLKQMAETNYV